MSTTISQMTPDEFRVLIQTTVAETMERKFAEFRQELEDDGEIRPEVRKRLLNQLNQVTDGERGMSLSEVQAQLGLA